MRYLASVVLLLALGQLSAPEQQYAVSRIRTFVMSARVPIGFELRPFEPAADATSSPPTRISTLPVVPPSPIVRGTSIDEVLHRFVGANAGYEWLTEGPMVRVRPTKIWADPANWLNAIVPTFDADNVSVSDALVLLRRRFDPAFDGTRVGAGPQLPPGSTLAMPPERLKVIEQAKGRPVSVHLAGATVRAVLDAIVLAHGEAGWIVTYNGAASHERAGVTVVFWAGTSVTTHGQPLSAQPASRSFRVPLPLTTSALSALWLGIGAASGPAGFEFGPECAVRQDRDGRQIVDVGGLEPSQLARLVLAECPGYEARHFGGVVNIGPVGSFDRPGFLDVRTLLFAVSNLPAIDVPFAIRRMLEPRAELFRQQSAPSAEMSAERRAELEAEQTRPVSVRLENATVRDALNAVVSAHGSSCWVVRRQPGDLLQVTLAGKAGWARTESFRPTVRPPDRR